MLASVLGFATAVLSLPAPAEADSHDLPDVAERALQSVVNISSTKVVRRPGFNDLPFHNDPMLRRFFGPRFAPGMPEERRQRSLGSGVIVTTDGIVLTNNHVVEKTEDIQVTLADGRELEAEIVGTDPKSDVAVLQLKDPPKGLKALKFGDATKLRLAETVLAIGNPFGVGQTITKGIVSATGRANVGIVDYEDFIQTDAAINPGNSGGALINTRGELVGINTAIMTRSGGHQGIGFAIPSNMARQIMESLKEHGKVVRGWLGVMIQQVDQDLGAALGLKPGERGVVVADVSEDSPASKAGLQRGDVILKVDGRSVETTGELRNIVASSGAGKQVRLSILRESGREQVRVTLEELPAHLAGPSIGSPSASRGVSVAPLDDTLRRKHDIPDRVESGIVVTDLDRDSEAAKAGLRPGDVILEINRNEIETVKDFRKHFVESDKPKLLLVARSQGTLFLAIGD